MKAIQYKNIGVILGIILLSSTGISQQLSLFNNNIVNPYSINPAMAGLTDNQLFFQHRKELVGIDGAPELSLLTAEFRLAKTKSAIGFQFSHEQANVIKNTSGYMTYAGHFKLNDNQKLSFGLSLGVRHNGIASDRVNVLEENDDVLFKYNQSTTNFDGNFGVFYQIGHLEFQASGHQLFGGKATYQNTFEQKEFSYQFIRHFVGSIGYQFREGKKFKIKPIIQARGAQGLPFLPEGILRFDYNDFVWLAGHYRNNASWAATVGMNINERFTVGYSAEFSSNKISGYNGGTHEIIFGLKLSPSKKNSLSPSKIREMEKRSKSYEERLEFLNQENKKLEEESKKQRERLKELENSSSKLDYNEIMKLIEEANKSKDTVKVETNKEDINETIKTKAKSIQFESGNDKLKASSYASLEEIVAVLQANENSKVSIKGYTDDNGSEKTNKRLSQERADAVKAYFISKGIDVSRITSTGYGESNPIATNESKEGRAQNRRVEIDVEF